MSMWKTSNSGIVKFKHKLPKALIFKAKFTVDNFVENVHNFL